MYIFIISIFVIFYIITKYNNIKYILFAATKTDKHFKIFSNQQNDSDNKIFDEQSVDEMSVT